MSNENNNNNIIDNTEEVSKNTSKQKSPGKKIRRKGKKAGIKVIPVVFLILAVLTVAGILLVTSGVFSSDSIVDKKLQENEELIKDLSEEIPQNLPSTESIGQGIIGHIVSAGRAVEEAYNKRPPEVEVNEENEETILTVDSCLYDPSTGYINVKYSSDSLAKSDDKFYYLFAINLYDDSRNLSSYEAINKIYKSSEGNLICSMNPNTASSRLYKKFGIAIKVDGEYRLLGNPSFVTNPESLAHYTNTFMSVSSKKGILIDYNRVNSGELEDLGVKQAALNIPISSILGPTTNAAFPSSQYTYNGKNYTFNGTTMAGFDAAISALTNKGIQVTAILLNDYSYAYNSLIHPDARTAGVCPYYMFNGATEDGVELLSAVGAYLADRYSGSKHGRVSNWVIANEINARKEWNYLKYTDVNSYTIEYAKAFRVLYTAIVSTSSTARVLISLDQTWDRNLTNSGDYDGKDVLDCFNAYIKKYGNINWSLAYHPYNVPLTSCSTWAASKYISHNSSTPMMSMQNIEVLINYMNQSSFLAPDGQCRSIMITELGYTSSKGEALQAAAIAYAFYKINHYQDIDGLLLNRETDSAVEIAQGLATGITTSGGGRKASYTIFKYMDTDQFESHAESLKSIIGISSWSEIMR